MSDREQEDHDDMVEGSDEDDRGELELKGIVRESYDKSLTVYWKERGKHYKGYFMNELKPLTPGMHRYSILCHNGKVSGERREKMAKEHRFPCTYRIR